MGWHHTGLENEVNFYRDRVTLRMSILACVVFCIGILRGTDEMFFLLRPCACRARWMLPGFGGLYMNSVALACCVGEHLVLKIVVFLRDICG